MKKHKLILTALCVLLIAGCGSKTSKKEKTTETKAVIQGDYGAQLPLEASETRILHASKRAGSMFDVFEIGKGLYERSKEHFSPDSYIQREGSLITYTNMQKLLGSISDKNSIGLNPKSDTLFDTGNGQTIQAPQIVSDIYEIDFMRSNELAGISVAIVLQKDHTSPAVTAAGVAYEQVTSINEDVLEKYGKEAALKLVSYLRSLGGVGDDMPIYVTLFNAASADNTLPGTFMSEAFFKANSRSSDFTAIDEKWMMFPSTAAQDEDSVTSSQFETLRKSLNQFLPEDVGIIAKGLYIDKKADTLYITINVQAKTYTECQALIQQTASLLDNFSDQSMGIKVNVKNGEETIATMVRAKNSSKVETQMMI